MLSLTPPPQLDASPKELVSESAYILFYVRKGMADVNIDDIYPAAEGQDIDPEVLEKLMRKRDSGRCKVM